MNRPTLPRTLVTAALAGLSAVALAQPPAARAPAAPRAFEIDIDRLTRDAERIAEDALEWKWFASAGGAELDFDADAPSFAFIAREFGSTREIVKNAPYQAEAVNEVVQTLSDGNRIVRRSATRVARDGYGRTRLERKGGPVYIVDPIDDKTYALNPERKTAVRIPRAPSVFAPPAPMAPATPSAAAPAPIPAMPPLPPIPAIASATPTPPSPPAIAPRAYERVVVKRSADGKDIEVGPGRVVVKRSTGDGKDGEDVRVEVVRVGREGHAFSDVTPMPSLALPLLPRGKGETRSLGTREFEGVKADGTMTSHTIPAGEIGNEKPIVITSERWFSPELHVVVYAKNSDPRSGDTIYRLASMKRGEPPADLFKVPADYRLRK